MFVVNTKLLATAALAGVVSLQPVKLASEREVREQLAPDSLVRALASHNKLLLALCLAERMDVNAADAHGCTPLLAATIQRDQEVIRGLLALGADPERVDEAGRTPLMIAAEQGDLALVQTFLGQSAQAKTADCEGRSAIHYAMAAGKYDCFHLLLSNMTETEMAAADGQELLKLACERGDSRTVADVAERLPMASVWTPASRLALKKALVENNPDLVRLILRKNPPPTVEGTAVPLLAQTIVEDDAATFRALLAGGADPNGTLPVPYDKAFAARISAENLRGYVVADQGVTVLMVAAGLGKTEYVRALLAAGADRNRQTSRYKMLALYFAARTKEPRCVQTLLGHGPTREELRVEISLASQRASVIKDGVAILHTTVSTGRKGFATPAGEYVITDKARSHRSTLYHAEMPFFMRLNCLDFGMHAGVVPNYPASHGCIRLPADVAQKMFSEVPVGTMVTIN